MMSGIEQGSAVLAGGAERPGTRLARRGRRFGDGLFGALLAAAAALIVAVLLGSALAVLAGGLPAFARFGFGFLTSLEWDPVRQVFGAATALWGTLVSALIAMITAIPVSLGIAVFLAEVAPRWLRPPLGIAIELLAGIPSIIYGMWGLFVFAPFLADHVEPALIATLGNVPLIGALFQGAPLGIGLLTAGLILGIMVVPFIASVARDAMALTPAALREAAFGLGATRFEVIAEVVIPYARQAIWGAVFLGLGRALGETMAVTFVLGNAHDFSLSLLMPATSISASIANEFTEADSDLYRSALMALGFLLFLITFAVLVLARWMIGRLERRSGAAR